MRMGFADLYFSKQKGFRPVCSEPPSEKLRFAVVIPAFREPDLITALASLLKCNRPKGHVEVIVVLNTPENADEALIENTRVTAEVTSAWMKENSCREFRFLLIKELIMPVKDAGVGLARKTGMDQALYRFNSIHNPGGCILSFDADCLCENNYFTAIEETLDKYPLTKGFNLYFQHPVSGGNFPDPVYRAIIAYEMHLRYLNLYIRHTGFPHAYHTVGSCFGVRADIYAREGGMNKRKAGEDFYFLHKIIPLGEFREVNHTMVIPSPRESDRVPFGTGAAISKYVESGEPEYLTYAPACFRALRTFFALSGMIYRMTPDELASAIAGLPEPLKNYLLGIRAVGSILDIRANTGSEISFVNRFFRWFDAFMIIKYLNGASRNHYTQIPVRRAVQEYLREAGRPLPPENTSDVELLYLLREIERNGGRQVECGRL